MNKVTFGSAPERRLLIFSIGVGVLLLILDQWTKILVEQRMRLGESIPVIPDCFSLTYVANKGAAWGMFHGYGLMLFGVGVTVMVLAIWFLRYLTEGYRERYPAIMIVLAGVLGNSIDRLWRGAVVDFLDFFWGARHWPAFNIADCAICVGIGLYFLSVLCRGREKPAEN